MPGSPPARTVSTKTGAPKPAVPAAAVGDVVRALPTANPPMPRMASLLIRRIARPKELSTRLICQSPPHAADRDDSMTPQSTTSVLSYREGSLVTGLARRRGESGRKARVRAATKPAPAPTEQPHHRDHKSGSSRKDHAQRWESES